MRGRELVIFFLYVLEFVGELCHDEICINIEERRIPPQMMNKVHGVWKKAGAMSGIGTFPLQCHEIGKRNVSFLRRLLERHVSLFSRLTESLRDLFHCQLLRFGERPMCTLASPFFFSYKTVSPLCHRGRQLFGRRIRWDATDRIHGHGNKDIMQKIPSLELDNQLLPGSWIGKSLDRGGEKTVRTLVQGAGVEIHASSIILHTLYIQTERVSVGLLDATEFVARHGLGAVGGLRLCELGA